MDSSYSFSEPVYTLNCDWIISCGKELIRDHNDIWSQTAMEIYAALYRAVHSRRHGNKLIGGSPNAAAGQTVALGRDFGAS